MRKLTLLCTCFCLTSLSIDVVSKSSVPNSEPKAVGQLNLDTPKIPKKNDAFGKMKAFGKRMSDEKKTKIKGGVSYYKSVVDSNPSLVEESIRQSANRSLLGPGPTSKSTPTFPGFNPSTTNLSSLDRSGTVDGAWTQREDGTLNLDTMSPDRMRDADGNVIPPNAYIDLGNPGDEWSDYTLSVTAETISQGNRLGASQIIFNSDGADPTKMNGWIFCNRADENNTKNFQLLKVVDGKRVGNYKGKVIEGVDRLGKNDYKIKTSSDGRIIVTVNDQECINIRNNDQFQTSGTAKVGGYNVDADFSNIEIEANE